MHTRGHLAAPRSKLEPHPRTRPKMEEGPTRDPIEAILLVPFYLVILAWIFKFLGLW